MAKKFPIPKTTLRSANSDTGQQPLSKAQIIAILREGTPSVIAELRKMIEDPATDERVRLLAIREWLDFDLGRPKPGALSVGNATLDGAGESTVVILPSNGYEVDERLIDERIEVRQLEWKDSGGSPIRSKTPGDPSSTGTSN
jgi:hypothetical protein